MGARNRDAEQRLGGAVIALTAFAIAVIAAAGLIVVMAARII